VVERNSRKLIKLLEKAGWFFIGATGDHHHFRHPILKGKVTVPHPSKDVSIGTVASIYRQAGWRK
jgi:predicted RNA binding protein YcfA (HicA-like mRNA interferase family)